MKRLLATTALLATLAAPALAADPKQELTINRGSATDQVTGLVVVGNSIVLVYGTQGMGRDNHAVRLTPTGNRLMVTYDTVGNLGLTPTGQPAMMMGPAGRQFPVYNEGSMGGQ